MRRAIRKLAGDAGGAPDRDDNDDSDEAAATGTKSARHTSSATGAAVGSDIGGSPQRPFKDLPPIPMPTTNVRDEAEAAEAAAAVLAQGPRPRAANSRLTGWVRSRKSSKASPSPAAALLLADEAAAGAALDASAGGARDVGEHDEGEAHSRTSVSSSAGGLSRSRAQLAVVGGGGRESARTSVERRALAPSPRPGEGMPIDAGSTGRSSDVEELASARVGEAGRGDGVLSPSGSGCGSGGSTGATGLARFFSTRRKTGRSTNASSSRAEPSAGVRSKSLGGGAGAGHIPRPPPPAPIRVEPVSKDSPPLAIISSAGFDRNQEATSNPGSMGTQAPPVPTMRRAPLGVAGADAAGFEFPPKMATGAHASPVMAAAAAPAGIASPAPTASTSGGEPPPPPALTTPSTSPAGVTVLPQAAAARRTARPEYATHASSRSAPLLGSFSGGGSGNVESFVYNPTRVVVDAPSSARRPADDAMAAVPAPAPAASTMAPSSSSLLRKRTNSLADKLTALFGGGGGSGGGGGGGRQARPTTAESAESAPGPTSSMAGGGGAAAVDLQRRPSQLAALDQASAFDEAHGPQPEPSLATPPPPPSSSSPPASATYRATAARRKLSLRRLKPSRFLSHETPPTTPEIQSWRRTPPVERQGEQFGMASSHGGSNHAAGGGGVSRGSMSSSEDLQVVTAPALRGSTHSDDAPTSEQKRIDGIATTQWDSGRARARSEAMRLETPDLVGPSLDPRSLLREAGIASRISNVTATTSHTSTPSSRQGGSRESSPREHDDGQDATASMATPPRRVLPSLTGDKDATPRPPQRGKDRAAAAAANVVVPESAIGLAGLGLTTGEASAYEARAPAARVPRRSSEAVEAPSASATTAGTAATASSSSSSSNTATTNAATNLNRHALRRQSRVGTDPASQPAALPATTTTSSRPSSLTRPYSLISADGNDTPILSFRKLVVDTRADDDDDEDDEDEDGVEGARYEAVDGAGSGVGGSQVRDAGTPGRRREGSSGASSTSSSFFFRRPGSATSRSGSNSSLNAASHAASRASSGRAAVAATAAAAAVVEQAVSDRGAARSADGQGGPVAESATLLAGQDVAVRRGVVTASRLASVDTTRKAIGDYDGTSHATNSGQSASALVQQGVVPQPIDLQGIDTATKHEAGRASRSSNEGSTGRRGSGRLSLAMVQGPAPATSSSPSSPTTAAGNFRRPPSRLLVSAAVAAASAATAGRVGGGTGAGAGAGAGGGAGGAGRASVQFSDTGTDALSALEAEVGQARRLEVVRADKVRVEEWAEALQRSRSVGRKPQPQPQADEAAPTAGWPKSVAAGTERGPQVRPTTDSQRRDVRSSLPDILDEEAPPSCKDNETGEAESSPSAKRQQEGQEGEKNATSQTEANSAGAPPSATEQVVMQEPTKPIPGLPEASAPPLLTYVPSSESIEEAARLGKTASKRLRRSQSQPLRTAGASAARQRHERKSHQRGRPSASKAGGGQGDVHGDGHGDGDGGDGRHSPQPSPRAGRGVLRPSQSGNVRAAYVREDVVEHSRPPRAGAGATARLRKATTASAGSTAEEDGDEPRKSRSVQGLRRQATEASTAPTSPAPATPADVMSALPLEGLASATTTGSTDDAEEIQAASRPTSKMPRSRSHRRDRSSDDARTKVASPGTASMASAPTSSSHQRQPTYATSEEAARAKRREAAERERRHRERQMRRDAEREAAYARRKRSDPLLAARLALAGLTSSATPGEDGVPVLPVGAAEVGQGAGVGDGVLAPGADASKDAAAPPQGEASGAGQSVPFVPLASVPAAPQSVDKSERGIDTGGAAATFAPPARAAAESSRPPSPHVGIDAAQNSGAAVSGAAFGTTASHSRKASSSSTSGRMTPVVVERAVQQPKERGATSSSLASVSAMAKLEFPVPPSRSKTVMTSEDGTVLARGKLRESADSSFSSASSVAGDVAAVAATVPTPAGPDAVLGTSKHRRSMSSGGGGSLGAQHYSRGSVRTSVLTEDLVAALAAQVERREVDDRDAYEASDGRGGAVDRISGGDEGGGGASSPTPTVTPTPVARRVASPVGDDVDVDVEGRGNAPSAVPSKADIGVLHGFKVRPLSSAQLREPPGGGPKRPELVVPPSAQQRRQQVGATPSVTVGEGRTAYQDVPTTTTTPATGRGGEAFGARGDEGVSGVSPAVSQTARISYATPDAPEALASAAASPSPAGFEPTSGPTGTDLPTPWLSSREPTTFHWALR